MKCLQKAAQKIFIFLQQTLLLCEGAQPVFILLHLQQESENGAHTGESFKCKFWCDSETLSGHLIHGCGDRDNIVRHNCSVLWDTSQLWAHLGWGAGTKLLLLAEFAQLNLLLLKPHRKGVLLPPCGAKHCSSILWSSPAPSDTAVYSRFSVAQLGACFVSSQRTLLTNSPCCSIKAVRKFWILFFLKKWLILHTVFLHLSLIYEALIEAGGVGRKFLFKFS